MIKKFLLLLSMIALVVGGVVTSASALMITTSASGSLFDDNYSYTFSISDTSNPNVYAATLTNTSGSSYAPLIDEMAFNMNAVLGTDFSIENVNPDWTFAAPTGSAIQFDYVGSRDTPGDRLAAGSSLTFDFVFVSGFSFGADPFTLWTATDSSLGTGFGGGEDLGQVAVSFQQLGNEGEGSDLLASNWGDTPGAPVPEPGTMLLLGAGLLGVAGIGRKHLNRKK